MGIKHAVNENFFAKWTPEMAYVLGFFCADGGMIDAPYMRGQYVSFFNTDQELLEKIKMAMSSRHNVRLVRKAGTIGNNKNFYLLKIGNHTLFKDLLSLGLTPNKSLLIRLPKIPRKFLNDYIRGLLDGDGCLYIEKPKRTLKLIFTSGSRDFLVDLMEEMRQHYKIPAQNILNGRRCFQLRFGQTVAWHILPKIYKNIENGLYLSRKYKIYSDLWKEWQTKSRRRLVKRCVDVAA